MSLSSLPLAFVVPPVNLLFPAVAGLLVAWRWPRIGGLLLTIAIGGLLLLSLPAVSKRLMRSLEHDLPLVADPANPPAAIVILASDGAHSWGRADVGALTLERERTGAALQRQTGLPVLVTGGPAELGGDPLALVMARSLAADFHVPVRWIEPDAQDTLQNAANSAAILHDAGIGSIYLVTHAWHMKRALQAFAGTGIAVTAVPVRMDPSPAWWADEFVPEMTAWVDSYRALHEWIGYAVARFGR